MKTYLRNLIFLFTLLAIACFFAFVTSGCVAVKDRQIVDKSTVFGFQAKSPGPEGTQIVIQFGLVRNLHVSNPVSTNPVHVAQFSSHVDADMTALHQNGKESISTLPQAITSSVTDSNTSTAVITAK